MYISTVYETDGGLLLSYSVGIYIGNDLPYKPEQVVVDPFIPSILLPNLVWFSRNPCPTKQVVARYVTITLVTGDFLKIGCPFRPGTANWFTFLQQLELPRVISVKGVGEFCNDKFLRNSLGIL